MGTITEMNGSNDSNSTSTNTSAPGSSAPDTPFGSPDRECRWNFAGNLVIAPNVRVTLQGDDCLLHISTGKMILLRQQATMEATSINIDASYVRLETKAKISATYSGNYMGNPNLFSGGIEFGASHGGSGGRRIEPESGRAYFDLKAEHLDRVSPSVVKRLGNIASFWNIAKFWTAPTNPDDQDLYNQLLLGSGSYAGTENRTLSVSAGGRIRISASKDLVLMDSSTISANGGSAMDGVAGGSGGSIFLIVSALSVNGNGFIEAKGGDAICRQSKNLQVEDCFPAGGGGRVMISYMSSQLSTKSIDVTGGSLRLDSKYSTLLREVEEKSLAGATGTYYRIVRTGDGQMDGSLLISNAYNHQSYLSDVAAGAVTSIAITSQDPIIHSLVISDNAVCSTKQIIVTKQDGTGDVKILNSSALVNLIRNGGGELMQIQAHDILFTDNSKLYLPFGSVYIQATSLVMDSSVSFLFATSARIQTRQTLHVEADISSGSLRTGIGILSLESEGDTIIGGSITTGLLSLRAKKSMSITGEIKAINRAKMDSTFRSCRKQQERYLFDPSTSSISNFTIFANAGRDISIGANTKAIISGGAILLCADESIHLHRNSFVTSNGMGQESNQGPGAGACVSSVGGGGGYGGRGADSNAVNEMGDYASGGLPYGSRAGAGTLGSGGGCVDGGFGGGIVMLGTAGIILDGEIHSNGHDGQNGAGGGSGGFLGITVSHYLQGYGRISAIGGNAQCIPPPSSSSSSSFPQTPNIINTNTTNSLNKIMASATGVVTDLLPEGTTIKLICGGGGGGGRLQLHGCDHSDFDKCTSGFVGNYTVSGGVSLTQDFSTATKAPPDAAASPGESGTSTCTGSSTGSSSSVSSSASLAAGSSGTFFGFPCAPGYGGLFCRICKVGTFKTESNSEECVPCTNAPTNSHYTSEGSISSNCEWACDPGYSGSHCVSPLQQFFDACGGKIGFVFVLMSIVVFFILLGFACRNQKEPSYLNGGSGYHDGSSGSKSERQHLLRRRAAVTNVTTRSRFAWLWRIFHWPRVSGYPKLMERDLPEHMARIYFSGTNDRHAPLKMRTTVPEPLKSVLYEEEFKQFAERINTALIWPEGILASWGNLFYFVVCFVCLPWASEVLQYRRHLRINALKRIVGRYNHACMKGPRARGLLNAVKLGYSGDYSLVYLELLYKESSKSICIPTTKIGRPGLPLVLLFAGCGTYNSPFYLDPNDLLVRSVPQCPELNAFIDDPWIEFVAELNALLRVVKRDQVCLAQTLLPVAQFLEKKFTASAVGGTSHHHTTGFGDGRSYDPLGTEGGSALKLGGLKIYLGRFYVQDEVDCGEEFKLGILLTIAGENQADTMGGGTSLQQPSKYGQILTSHYGSVPRSLDTMDTYTRTKQGNSNDALGYYGELTEPSELNGGYGSTMIMNPLAIKNNNSSIRRGSNTQKPLPAPVLGIREEALRGRTNTAGSTDGVLTGRTSDDSMLLLSGGGTSGTLKKRASRKTRTFYQGWLGPVDASLPLPGVLICADELEDRLAERTKAQVIESFVRMHVVPCNVPSSSLLTVSWMLYISLLILLSVDLGIMFAMIVNLKCVSDGEVDEDCSAAIMIPVLLIAPFAIIVSPVMGIISLALSSAGFSRKYSIWNALSMINVFVAIVACIIKSSQLVAPWFTAPLPVLPLICLVVKIGEAYTIERYIAFLETYRRRRGWRGLMKQRLSDASNIPSESP
jgi:hypothetical protein